MIKITAQVIGELISRQEKYVYVLLRRRGLKLKDIKIETLIDLICEYRGKNKAVDSEKGAK